MFWYFSIITGEKTSGYNYNIGNYFSDNIDTSRIYIVIIRSLLGCKNNNRINTVRDNDDIDIDFEFESDCDCN